MTVTALVHVMYTMAGTMCEKNGRATKTDKEGGLEIRRRRTVTKVR